jgi:hypothetical protein
VERESTLQEVQLIENSCHNITLQEVQLIENSCHNMCSFLSNYKAGLSTRHGNTVFKKSDVMSLYSTLLYHACCQF